MAYLVKLIKDLRKKIRFKKKDKNTGIQKSVFLCSFFSMI